LSVSCKQSAKNEHQNSCGIPAEEEAQVKGVLIVASLCLAAGVGLIFGFCNGTTGFNFGVPLSATSLHIDITTTGVPAVAGLALTLLGAFLLMVATIIAFVGMFQRNEAPIARREEPFAE
jgi:hypothetical protein